ncbi:MAG: HTTM domain-containing protein, partial [Nannocystaceae bacterium]
VARGIRVEYGVVDVDTAATTGARAVMEQRVSASSLVVLRVCVGVAISVEALRYIVNDWVRSHLVDPVFHFAYPGLGWVAPSSFLVMNALLCGLVVLGALLAAGWRTRWVAAINLVGWAYVIAIDRALYLNHHYLVLNLLLVWCLMPEVRRRGTVRFLWVGGVRALLLVVYVWAGVSKFDADWAAGVPVAMGTGGLRVIPWIGPLLISRPFVIGTSWALILIEIGAPVWLVLRRTRPWAMAAFASFHVATAFFYEIGIFPWVSLALLSTWLSPSWASGRRGGGADASGEEDSASTITGGRDASWRRRVFMAFVVVHMVAPARALLVGGNLAWNGGAQIASWRLLTAQKTGWCRFEVVDVNTKERSQVSPLQELTVWQAGKLARNPDMIVTFARHLAERVRTAGAGPVKVFVHSGVSLNGRVPSPVFDPELNVVPEFTESERAPLVAAAHVLPLETEPATDPVRFPDGWWEANMWGATAILYQVTRADQSGDEVVAREMTTLLPLVEEMSLLDATGAVLALLRFGFQKEAMEMLDRPARADESVCAVMLQLDDALRQLGEPTLQDRALQRCIDQRRDPVALGRLADRAIAAGDLSGAQRWLEWMVIEDPEALEPSLKLAELYAKYLNRPNDARRLFDTIALHHPAHPRVAEVRRVLDELAVAP